MGAAASLMLLVVVPFGLAVVGGVIEHDWSTVSDIGEAYGAVVAGVAVVGVAISLYYQGRQARMQQVQSMRSQQLELMKLLLDDPALMAVSVTAGGLGLDRWRQGIFINLMFKHLEMGYLTGYTPEAAVSLHVCEYFNLDHVREWWRESRDLYRLDAATRQRRNFVALVDAEYQRATLELADVGAWRIDGSSRRWSRGKMLVVAAAVTLPAVGLGVVWLNRRLR